MSREKREQDYPVDLESQFILRLPEQPAQSLRELLKSGDSLKNRLMIQIDNDMRNGQVRLDHWLMHAKIVDLPTIIESLKTIDNKSFYKTADVCQMMICKDEPDPTAAEEEQPSKNKKKDPYKVDKKFLYPHGITPPTKNARKRRFRKTLKKKYVEAPEIEKEVKRLLRADNEAVSVTWEVVTEDDEQNPKIEQPVPSVSTKPDKKNKQEKAKLEATPGTSKGTETSNVVDIFGGAVSDSEEEDNTPVDNAELEVRHFSAFDSRLEDTNSITGLSELHLVSKNDSQSDSLPIEFASNMFDSPLPITTAIPSRTGTPTALGAAQGNLSSEEDDYLRDPHRENNTERIAELKAELDELKQRRVRTQHEISGMENMALRQRFQDILHTLNQDILFKEMEYQGLLVLETSEVI